ncbi:unnamed protein product, partial [Durusdinium trenchii]
FDAQIFAPKPAKDPRDSLQTRGRCRTVTAESRVAPSFLAPNGQTPSVPRVQGIVSYQAQGRSPGSAIPGLAVAGVATSALAALKVGKTTSKTSRHFFGGTSPATFDPATQLGVQVGPVTTNRCGGTRGGHEFIKEVPICPARKANKGEPLGPS